MVLNSLQDVNTKVVTFINITKKTHPNNISISTYMMQKTLEKFILISQNRRRVFLKENSKLEIFRNLSDLSSLEYI